MIPVQFSHMAMSCKDPLAVERFYTQYFGFHRARIVPIGGGHIVFLRCGDAYLELFQATGDAVSALPDRDGPAYPGWRHIAFKVADVEAKLAEMGEAAQITLGPLSFDEVIPGWRSVWIADPNGSIVEISQGYVDQEKPPMDGAAHAN